MTAEDLLRRTLRYLKKTDAVNTLAEDIEKYLAEPKDDPKPVLYIKDKELMYIQILKQEGISQEWRSNLGFVKENGDVGLYTHPPAKTAQKEQMTEEEIDKEWADNDVCCYDSFSDGIRFAEKFHGIGAGDE